MTTKKQQSKAQQVTTFDEAVAAHKMVVDGAAAFQQKGELEQGARVWGAIVGGDEALDTLYADAVRTTMPTGVVPLVRAISGVAAAYAFEAMAAFYPDASADGWELREAATEGWKAFEERRKQANAVKEGFGWDLSPSWEQLREVSEFGDVSHVLEIAQLAGRMFKAMARDAAKSPTDDPHEVKDVNLGGDPERLLAGELAQLFEPGLDDIAAMRILQKQAQQYRMKGVSSTTRGPLVVCLDESGSMHDRYNNHRGATGRNTWAKAALVALARIAHAGDRMVRVVHFGTATAVSELAPGDARAIIDATRHFLGGGTSIAKALSRAVQQVGDLEKEGHVGADIVLITDGEDDARSDMTHVLNLMQQRGIRLWTVAIEMEIAKDHPVAWRAEKVIRVGASLEADIIAALRDAAQNVVTNDHMAQAKARAAAAN